MTDPGTTPQAFYLLLDTRNIWNAPVPTSDQAPTPQQPAPHDSKQKLDACAPAALALVSPEEQTKALGFHFLRDARLSLGSSLLKRTFVLRALGGTHDVSAPAWGEVGFARREGKRFGKPCYDPPPSSSSSPSPHLDFNVSHQAGVVVLAGFSSPATATPVSVGVDVTCTTERRERDLRSLRADAGGFDSFVEMHEDVFSEADVESIKHGGSGSGEAPDEQLRRFYAYWALKEAYVKMEGEALLAKWLREVRFVGVRVPAPAREDGGGPWGECVEGIEVWLRGERRKDVVLFLQAFEEGYLVATSVMTGGAREDVGRPEWDVVTYEKDIEPLARPGAG